MKEGQPGKSVALAEKTQWARLSSPNYAPIKFNSINSQVLIFKFYNRKKITPRGFSRSRGWGRQRQLSSFCEILRISLKGGADSSGGNLSLTPEPMQKPDVVLFAFSLTTGETKADKELSPIKAQQPRKSRTMLVLSAPDYATTANKFWNSLAWYIKSSISNPFVCCDSSRLLSAKGLYNRNISLC